LVLIGVWVDLWPWWGGGGGGGPRRCDSL